jgi:hypothetical protein
VRCPVPDAGQLVGAGDDAGTFRLSAAH